MSQQAHKPRHVASMLAAATVMIASCSDDELAPPQSAEAIENAAAHLAVVTGAIWMPVTATSGGTGVVAGVVLPEVVCVAGARETSSESRRSPFALLPLQVQRTEFTGCLLYGDAADPLSARYEVHGVEERGLSGTAFDGGQIRYVRDGEEDGTPLVYRGSAPGGSGLIEVTEVRVGRRDSLTAATGNAMVTEDASVYSHQIYRLYASGSRFEGRYILGTTAHPFRVRREDVLVRLSGAYEFQTPLCSYGNMRVETQQDLEYDGAVNSFSSGKLRFVGADGSSATATFLGGGRVRIEDAGGVSEIQDWRLPGEPWVNDCFGQWAE
jgi:hypothetical protein